MWTLAAAVLATGPTIGWLDGRYSFDTGIDPFGNDTHHGVLVVHNHATIAPQGGFDTHRHRDMEIITCVLGGTMVHQDFQGHNGAIYPNLAQRMSAGTGIWHSEKNDGPGTTELVDLVQMWVVPDETGVTPGYQQLNLTASELDGKLAVRHLRDPQAPRRRRDTHPQPVGRPARRAVRAQSITIPDAPIRLHLPRSR